MWVHPFRLLPPFTPLPLLYWTRKRVPNGTNVVVVVLLVVNPKALSFQH